MCLKRIDKCNMATCNLSQIKSFSTIFCEACGKGYMGPNCETKCPYPLYGEVCQMSCNCIDKNCDPVNGCNQWLSTGIDMISISLKLTGHFKPFTNIQLYVKLCIHHLFQSIQRLIQKTSTTR